MERIGPRHNPRLALEATSLKFLDNAPIRTFGFAVASLLFLLAAPMSESTTVPNRGFTTERLNLRQNPGLDRKVLVVLEADQPVDVLGSEGDWLEVRTRSQRGWVHRDWIWLLPESLTLQPTKEFRERLSGTATTTLNLRSAPSRSSLVIATLPPATEFSFREFKAPWLAVSTEVGEGWVHGAFVATREIAQNQGAGTREAGGGVSVSNGTTPPAAQLTRLPATRPEPALRTELVATYLNQKKVSDGQVVLIDEQGQLLMPCATIAQWRIEVESLPPAAVWSNQAFCRVADIEAVDLRFDSERQEVWLEAAPEAFRATELDLSQNRFVAPVAPSLGGFFDYSLNASSDFAGGSDLGGRFEVGLFGSLGTLSTEIAATDDARSVTRLQTTWRHDLAVRMERFEIGDSVTPSGDWWQGVFFGGAQWRSNFTTQPGFRPYPLPSFAGEATLPSQLELYFGEVLRLREDIPNGPFSLRNLPVVNGQGSYRLVVRDYLGQEIIYTADFYSTPVLLRQGIREFSHGLGWIRQNLGQASNDYGRLAYVGTERLGLSNRFTLELHGELLEEQQTLGVGGILLSPRLGVFHASYAASSDSAGAGHLISYGFDRQAGRINIGLREQRASSAFSRLGASLGERSSARDTRARLSVSLGPLGSLSLAYGKRSRHSGASLETLSASFGARLGRSLFLNLSALESRTPDRDRSILLSLSRLLGPARSAGLSTRYDRDGATVGINFRQATLNGPSLGYSLSAESGRESRVEAALEKKTTSGTLRLRAAQIGDTTAARLNLSGTLVALGAKIYAARSSPRSYGLVSTRGFAGVGVYHQNHFVGRTNTKGFLLVPGLLPFQENSIRIDEQDLPFGALLETVEQDVSTYERSGIVIDFAITQSRQALVVLHDEFGELIPAGARVRSVTSGLSFPVAYRGEVFLTGLVDENEFVAEWEDRRCMFTTTWPDLLTTRATLGSLVCRSSPP